MLIHNADITGSLTINGIPFNTGSFSGSFKGTIEGVSATASYVEYTNVANKPTLVSGSSQITYSGLTGIPSGIVSGSSQVTYSGLTGIPSGIVSGSAQVDFAGISNKPTLVSGSSQITYSGLTGIPSGIVSGSAQIAGLGYATTSSNTFIGNQTITGSVFGTGSLTIDGCITATGQIVAQTINVQQVTSSIVYSCGSNVFGTSLGNTQQFTGSMFITGSNLNANVGSACFQGSVCAPSFIGDVQSSILCSNTINLSGNNNALACNNTLRFTDTDTATELNQQIGKIEFFSCDSSTPGAGVKAYIGAFAADSTPDAYIAFATQDGSGTPNPVERLKISSEGIACFQNNVCAPNAVISNCLGVGISVPQGNFEAVGLSYFTRTNNSLLINPNYGGASTHVQLQVVCNMALSFATNGDNERMRITSTGIACFACQVCAPVAIFSGCVGIGITGPNAPLHVVKDLGTSVTAVARLRGSNSTARTTRLQFEDYNGTIADGLIDFVIPTAGSSTGARLDIGVNSANMSLINGGVSCFIGTVCTPLLTVNSAVRLYGSAGGVGCAYIVTATGTNEQPAIILEKAGGFGQSEIRTYYNDVPNYGIAFRAGSTTGMHLNSSGYVGIGTPTPLYTLHLEGASAGLNFTGGNNRIYFTNCRALEGAANGSLLQIGEGYSCIILQSNRTGIGTSSPNNTLTVNANGANRGIDLTINNTTTVARFGVTDPNVNNNPFIGGFSNNDFLFYSNSAERIKLTSTGIACFACQVCAPVFIATNSITAQGFNTSIGTVSAATSTWVTIYTISSIQATEGVYNVYAHYNDDGGGMAFTQVLADRTHLREANKSDGTAVSIQLSGRNIQVQQIYGTTVDIQFSILWQKLR